MRGPLNTVWSTSGRYVRKKGDGNIFLSDREVLRREKRGRKYPSDMKRKVFASLTEEEIREEFPDYFKLSLTKSPVIGFREIQNTS